MLKFDGAWRFDSPGEIAPGVIGSFYDLINRIAAQADRKSILEYFKSYFANAAGRTYYRSSDIRWAESDLRDYMNQAGSNAPLFIETFYDACEALHARNPEITVPDVARINRVLFENDAGYEIRPPDLISNNPPEPIQVPERLPSLDRQAQEVIQESLKTSEQLLSQGTTVRQSRRSYGCWKRYLRPSMASM